MLLIYYPLNSLFSLHVSICIEPNALFHQVVCAIWMSETQPADKIDSEIENNAIHQEPTLRELRYFLFRSLFRRSVSEFCIAQTTWWNNDRQADRQTGRQADRQRKTEDNSLSLVILPCGRKSDVLTQNWQTSKFVDQYLRMPVGPRR